MTPFEAAARGHRRDRPRGARDHASPGRDLRAGLVHVEHLGPLPLPVRHHRGGGGAGQPAGLLHADADDERPPAARRGRRGHGGHDGDGRSRRGFYARIDRGYDAAAAAGPCSTGACGAASALAVMVAVDPALRAGQGRSTSRATSTRPSSRSTSPRPRARASPRWTRRCAPSRPSIRAMPGVRDGARHRRRRLPRRRQPGTASTSASRRTRSASSRSAASSASLVAARPLAPPSAATTAQRDVMQAGARQAAQVHGPALVGAQRRSPSTSAAATGHRLRPPRPGPAQPRRLRRAAARHAPGDRRHRRRRHHAQARQARAARGRSTASAPPTSGVDTEDIAHGAAPDGRRRRGGLALPRPDGQRGLRRPAPAVEGDAQRPGGDRAGSTCRAPSGEPGRASTTSSRSSEATTASRIDRLDRQRQVQPARRRRPRATRSPTASRRCARRSTR